MTRWNGSQEVGLSFWPLAATSTAGSALGDLTVSNESSADVTVSTGDEEIMVQ
jgi:hypothetical protein